MARFNQSVYAPTKTTNLAGGEAYITNPKFEFVSILLTSFVQDQFYRSASDTLTRLKELLPLVGWKFAAQAALYARREFGMRSITHVVAGEIAKHCKGETWTRGFLKNVFKRPDDMLEVMAYYTANYGKRPIPNSLKAAVREKLASLDEYSLAKYKGENKAIKMVDLVRLTHPKRTEAIRKLVFGELKSLETWETKLTQAGQKAESEEDKAELKGAAWKDLLTENKLGYLALLRNCRNIMEQAKDCKHLLCAQLVDEIAIKKSLVFPFQINTAIGVMQENNADRQVMSALVAALDISLNNVPKFDGKTLVVVDGSASMAGKPIDIASILAAVLYKSNDADLMVFSDNAKYISPIFTDSCYSIADKIKTSIRSAGTNFNAIFEEAAKVQYARIIILSDMQGWIGHHTPTATFERWKKASGANPFIYSFDLAGHGTLQLPEQKVFCMAGFSDKIFKIMELLEQDKNALVHTIERYGMEES